MRNPSNSPQYQPDLSDAAQPASLNTSALWDATHAALCAAKWSEARALLDALGRRGDVFDKLMAFDNYREAAELAGAPKLTYRAENTLRVLLQDRIDQVNARIELRRIDARY